MKLAFALIIVVCLAFGCKPAQGPPPPAAPPVVNKTTLPNFMNIPRGAEVLSCVQFSQPAEKNPPFDAKSGAGVDWGIIVVMSFTQETYSSFVAQCKHTASPIDFPVSKNVITDEIRSYILPCLTLAPNASAYHMRARESYEPTPLFKDPLRHGFMIPLKDKNQIIVVLYTA
jgi:hypothetical protein